MRKILALGLLLIILVACGIDNTMYNAQNYFKSAQARPLNANGRPTPQAVADYTKTIQKCGIILSQNREGRRADDALYLMARALYYKGNSAFQAKDAFEGLIRGYPNSRHVPDSHIYLAKVLREINQPSESEALLERFVRDPKFIKHHPRALLVLADFEIRDKDYYRAQYWLERIIKDYRKTPEFREAFFLFGKNYYMQNDFTRSLEEFQKYQNTRGIDKEMKMEAQYYIALNQFELGDYDSALRNTRSLIRNEIRPDKLAAARVLYGRALLAEGRIEDGLFELDDVTKKYPRTEQAAEAYYHWGAYLYFREGKIDAAIPHLNKVRTEFTNSPFATKGQQIATALGQIKPPANLNSRSNLQGFLDHYYLKAEYFVSPLALPDSALASYQRVIDEFDVFKVEADSLALIIADLNAQIDSLNSLPEVMDADSLSASEESPEEFPSEAQELIESIMGDSPQESMGDSLHLPQDLPDLSIDKELSDSLSIAVADSVKEGMPLDEPLAEPGIETELHELEENELELPAELELAEVYEDLSELIEPEDSTAVADSLAAMESLPETPEELSLVELRDRLVAQRDDLQIRLDPIAEIIGRFEQEILPFSYFSIYSIYHNLRDRRAEADNTLAEMQNRFPRNMYTRAATALKNGTTPRLVDPNLEAAEDAFDEALGFYPDYPDSLVSSMQEFALSPYPELQVRANYRLGWYYSFEAPDTTLAKDYLEAVLAESDTGDFGTTVRRFFDGSRFLLRDSGLPDTLAVTDSLSVLKDVESLIVEADSLLWEIADPDSLLNLSAFSDSLSSSEADSLSQQTVPDEAKPNQEEAPPLLPDDSEPKTPEAIPPLKEEEIHPE